MFCVYNIVSATFAHSLNNTFKYLIIFAEEKALSGNKIIEFFSFSFILKNIFYFSLFVFVYKNHLIRRDNV